MNKVIEYNGEIPDGILKSQLSMDDFYTPKDMCVLILRAFPEQRENKFKRGVFVEYLSLYCIFLDCS